VHRVRPQADRSQEANNHRRVRHRADRSRRRAEEAAGQEERSLVEAHRADRRADRSRVRRAEANPGERNPEANRQADHRADRSQAAGPAEAEDPRVGHSREARRAGHSREARPGENQAADPSRLVVPLVVRQGADHRAAHSRRHLVVRQGVDPNLRLEDRHHPVGNRHRPTRARSRLAWGQISSIDERAS
jgi:hypothetical protein